MDVEQIFNNIFLYQNTFPFNRDFLKEKITYYKEKGEMRPELQQDIFIYENYDAFEIWCDKNNKITLYPHLKFEVKGFNI